MSNRCKRIGIVACVLSLMFVTSLVVLEAGNSDGATNYEVSNEIELLAAVASASDGDVIMVTQDITLYHLIYIGNKHITIMGQGDGMTISRGAGFSSAFDPARHDYNPCMIEVATDSVDQTKTASLTLKNITLDDMNDPDKALHTNQIPVSGGSPQADWMDRIYDSVISTCSPNAVITLGEGASIVNIGGASAIRITGGVLNLDPGSYVEGSNGSYKSSGPKYFGALWLQGNGSVLNFDTTMDGGPGRSIQIIAPYIYTDYPVTVNFSGKINNCDVRQPLFRCTVGGCDLHLTESSEVNGNVFLNTKGFDIGGNDNFVEFNGKMDGNADTGSGAETSHLINIGGSGSEIHIRGEINGNNLKASVLMVSGFGTNNITLHPGSTISGNTVYIAALRQYNTYSHFDIYGEVSYNISTGDNGGGFYLSYGTATLYDGAVVTGNQAFGSGGGFYLNQGSTLEVKGGEISYNIAKCLRADHVSEGTAGGGGILISASGGSASKLIMTGGSITNNTSAGIGGGIYMTGRSYGHTMVLEGGTVKDNTAATPDGMDIAVGAAWNGNTSSLSGGYYVSVGKDVSMGSMSIAAGLYTTADYDKGGVYVTDRTSTVRIGNVGATMQALIAGRVTGIPEYAGYIAQNSVWYSIEKTAGTSGFTITYPPGIGDPNDYEWIAAIQPLGAGASDSGDTYTNIVVPQRTARGLDVTVPLLASAGGMSVDGYAVLIMAMPKNTDMTLDVTHSGDGEFYIDYQGSPLYQIALSTGDNISGFVISPSSGWNIKSVVLTAGDGSVFDKTGDAFNGTIEVSYGELASGANTITAVFEKESSPPLPPSPSKDYYITAAADSGSTISPSGTVAVPEGESKTFTFLAKEGYKISSVTVDGTPLSQEEIASGSYTFYNVNMNHTISVVSEKVEDGGNGGGEGETPIPPGPDEPGGNGGSWAVLNLICAIVALLVGIAVLFAGRNRIGRRKDDATTKSKNGHRSKPAMALRIIGLIIGIVSMIVFFLTEDWTLPVEFTDGWTLLMIVLLLAALIVSLLSFRLDRKDEDNRN